MKRIVWLASYPKSGNTWVRILLANYLTLNPSRTATRLDRLEFGRIASLRALFDEWSCLESSDMPPEDANDLRADVYRAIARHSPEPLVYLKVHDAWSRDTGVGPLFPADATAAVVYIVRHPYDVAVSLAHHLDSSLDDSVSLVCSDTFTLFPEGTSLSPQFPQHVSSWDHHVRSWIDDSNLPIIPIKYEDLHADTHGTLGHLLAALRIPVDGDRLSRAVEASSFERLQHMENTLGFPERRSQTSPFFRNGRTGDGFSALTASHISRINTMARAEMARFGYPTG